MKQNTSFIRYDSPFGSLELEAADEALTAIRFDDFEGDDNSISDNEVLTRTKKQLAEYFNGSRTAFDLRLKPEGTDFEKEVWKQLSGIKYGTTITYAELAKQLADPNKVRAVGRANGQNPIPIVIPCHRVIGAGNKLVGYSGGIENKRWLLQHEGALLL